MSIYFKYKHRMPIQSNQMGHMMIDIHVNTMHTQQDQSQKRSGTVRLESCNLFNKRKIVLWKHIETVVVTLLCDDDANLLLGDYFLRVFMHALYMHALHTHSSKNKSNILIDLLINKPEEVLTILHKLLPGGELLFANAYLIKAQLLETKGVAA
eukprot:GHVR01133592.1.p1 GENE.GHVR01133592.1~~GHVR01133592.1.p1  ORF type:complete len:154 (+),score=17.85 GHVR01133592.1:142-603(+)